MHFERKAVHTKAGPLTGQKVARDGESSRGRREKRETTEGTKDRTDKEE